MILLQSDKFQIDLSGYGIFLHEENGIFSDNIYNSYSLPFTIKADSDLLAKLDLPTEENIVNVNMKIQCRLVLHDRHFPATLYLGEYQNNYLECTLTYGENQLAVFDTELKDLPWPNIIVSNLRSYAKSSLQKSWPEWFFQFPMVYAPDMVDGDNYELFEGFVNNFDATADEYKENEIIQETDDEGNPVDVYVNRNVMAPFPYLAEILRFGFAQENKKVIGQLIEDEDFKKALYIPENYLEEFQGSEFDQVSFSTRTGAEALPGQNRLVNIYEHSFSTTRTGTYNLQIKLNIPPALASFFELIIYREDSLSGQLTEIKSYISNNTRVTIDEKIKVNVENSTQFDNILVRMRLSYTDVNISSYNSFEWSFDGGQLNVFPHVFSLKDFVPDMNFGEFVNALKNWLNLEITIYDNYVRLDFVKDSVFQKYVRGHSHLEVPDPTWKSNSNRFYKLNYANDEKIFYNKNGQVYSDYGHDDDEIVEINMDVQPALVESNKNVITAVAPEDRSEIDFLLFGTKTNARVSPDDQKFSLQQVFNKFWLPWIDLRVNSKTLKDNFTCSVFEKIDIQEISNKYNENTIIKKLKKKFISESRMEVDVEGETF